MLQVRYALTNRAGKDNDQRGEAGLRVGCPKRAGIDAKTFGVAVMELPDLRGRTMLVTGASSGLGRAAALRLAAAGATVLAHGRSAEKLSGLAAASGIVPLLADFTRLDEVRRLAETVLERTGRLDAILHNAGAYYRTRVLTEDGHEATFQTNHLAPFLLQLLLEGLVVGTPDSRVVITTSVAARRGRVILDDLEGAHRSYQPFRAYASTKAMNILTVRELRRRFAAAGTSTTALAVHPGAVGTNFGAGSLLPRFLYRIPIRKELLIGYFVHTPEEGAEPLVRLAARAEGLPRIGTGTSMCADVTTDADAATDAEASTGTDGPTGLYFDRFTSKRPPTPLADDLGLARALWERSEELVRSWAGP